MYVIGSSSRIPCYHAAMIRALFASWLALLAFAAACGGTGGPGQPALPTSGTPIASGTACTPVRAAAPGGPHQALVRGDVPRGYGLYIPAGYDGSKAMPLVLAFHAFGLSASQMADYTGLQAIADEHGFVVVTPEGAGAPQHWNWRKVAAESDDVRFVSDLLARLDSELCLDPGRVFVAGFSDGAAMSRVLACDLPDRFAAVGVVASPSVPCVAPIPMIAFHGTADPLVPFEGGVVPASIGGGGTFPPVRRGVSEWARALGCDGLPRISRPSPTVELSTFVHCKLGDRDALLYTLLGGGHTWPGSAPLPADQFGTTNAEVDATATMWDFFAAHPRAQ